MKGIEGLALKYILLIVVAALVIGTAFAIVTTFAGTASSSARGLNQTLSVGQNQTNANACISLGCKWDGATQACKCD